MKPKSYLYTIIGLVLINLLLVAHNSRVIGFTEPFTVNVEYLQLVKSPDNNRIILENLHNSGFYWSLDGPTQQAGFVSKNRLSKRLYLPDGDYLLRISQNPFEQAAMWPSADDEDTLIKISLQNGLLCRARIESI